MFRDEANIQLRAQRIHDPVERLRYLRQVTTDSESGRTSKGSRVIASALVLMGMVIPLSSDALVRVHVLTPPPAAPSTTSTANLKPVWPVEQNKDYDLYSNGLRIENDLAVANHARSYHLIPATPSDDPGPLRAQPAGIVFHTTESDQAPFEPGQSRALQRIGRELLLYVRHKRAYHFVIDRFGRVHRIVVESDTANHAGHSVWADAQWLYVGLNASFLGVAFEAQTQNGTEPVNQAQIHAARTLTEMLRAKYNLPEENCVTHAQVSVNPANMRIGWHTDWGSRFPFEAVGLANNYERPNPGLYEFGFDYDPIYRKSTGPDLWKGLDRGEQQLRENAARQGVTAGAFKKFLQQRYRTLESALRDPEAVEEN